MKLIRSPGEILSGEILFNGEDIVAKDEEETGSVAKVDVEKFKPGEVGQQTIKFDKSEAEDIDSEEE